MNKLPDLPKKLDNDLFKTIWLEFQQHRKEIRHTLTPTSAVRILKKLEQHPLEIAIKMLEQSIEMGWQGVFDLKAPLTPRAHVTPINNAPARPRSTYWCPSCNTQHPISAPCPPVNTQAAALLNELTNTLTSPTRKIANT